MGNWACHLGIQNQFSVFDLTCGLNVSSNIVVKYGVAFGGRTVSLTKLAYLITNAFIGRDGRSADEAALCSHHSFSHVAFGGHIVSYRITIFCVISSRIYRFLLRPYHAITTKVQDNSATYEMANRYQPQGTSSALLLGT